MKRILRCDWRYFARLELPAVLFELFVSFAGLSGMPVN